MMRPPRGLWLFMILKASCVHRNMPVRLVFTTACHCSSVRSSSMILPGVPIPALLKFGRLDVLFNNAGIDTPGKTMLEDRTLDQSHAGSAASVDVALLSQA